MRVVHAIHGLSPNRGGPINALGGYIRAARAAGVESEVIATDIDGNEMIPWVHEERVRIFPTTHLAGYAVSRRMLDAVLEAARSADVVHVHGLWRFHGVAATLATVARRAPTVIRPCGHLTPDTLASKSIRKYLYLHLVERHVLGRATLLHFTTDGELRATRSPFNAQPSFVLPPPVVAPERRPRSAARRRLGIPEGARLAVSVGRLDPIKRVEMLIRAASKVPGMVLGLVGPSASEEYAGHLEALAASLEVSDRVVFAGYAGADAKAEWLSAADAFVTASRHENFGLAIAEADVFGLPVVAPAELPITAELPHDLLFRHGEEAQLEDKLRTALESSPGGDASSENRWSVNAIGKRLRAAYEEACERALR